MRTFDAVAACSPVSYYKISTSPQNVTVTNVRCTATGAGASVCAFLNVAKFQADVAAEIARRATTGPTQVNCAGACQPLKLADFDKTKPYSGSDVAFVDQAGHVVPNGSRAVSRIDFDWSLVLRFVGEIGLCLSNQLAAGAPFSELSVL
jgi:hypothetical protein